MKKELIFVSSILLIISMSNVYATSSIITTPNSWSSPIGQYPSSYNATTGNTSFSNLPSGSNGTGGPNTQSCSSGYGVNGYNATTKILTCIPFLTSSGSTNSTLIHSPYNYIVNQTGNMYYAQNSNTGRIDYSGTDAGLVVYNAAHSYYPNAGSVLVKCGTYYAYSEISLFKSSSLHGEGQDCTIFKRMFNATVSQVIRSYVSYQGYDGYATLSDFTIDGNFGHSNATEEMSITGNGAIENVKIKNYNGMALEADNNVTITHFTAIGVNSPTVGSTMGLWTGANSRVTMTNSDIENNRTPAVFAQGNYTEITNSFFSHNHCQTSPTGGGQVALINGGTLANNRIVNGCGTVTSGIEVNAGVYILVDNTVTGNKNYGIATNGQNSTIISSNNYLRGNGHALSALGLASLFESNDVK